MKTPSSLTRTRRIAAVSISIALAAAGSFIKIPSPVGSVALDSWPGFACALVIGPEGALVALGGHLMSGFLAGLPLGLALHLIVGAEMALCALAFRWVTLRLGAIAGVVAAVALNGLVSPLALIPWLGRPLVISLLLPLTVAAGVNVAAAVAVAGVVSKSAGFSWARGARKTSGDSDGGSPS